ncbi:energy transducer TonB [Paraburkholderia ferrariae]|uniref:energy transducer TonB n=1 Tax=Paraburkholderia ferrariae TaxID=386056 RepID=UPI001FDF0649|nr:energy transducer TonB [Paraburkholderia ferrariae]
MNSGLQKFFVLADRDCVRLGVALVLAALTCLGLLAHVGDWFAVRVAAPKPNPPIDMRLVEIAPAPPAAPVVHAAVAPAAVATRPAQVRTRATPARETPVQRNPLPALPVREEVRGSASPSTHEESSSPSVARPASATTSQSTEATPAAPGSTQARVLAQPTPVLPDDLREQGYQVTAVAHFKVHPDGSFDVELVKPTQNPRLNQILLETLHHWRFFPAMENGHPVESEQDVRVHFTVS